MRQDSKKLEKFLGKWNRKTETDGCTQQPSNFQPGAGGHQGGSPGCNKAGETRPSPPG